MANGSFVGYGYPGSPTTNNKRIQEYTVGVSQVLWKSDRYGDLKLLLQYSYLERDRWKAPAQLLTAASRRRLIAKFLRLSVDVDCFEQSAIKPTWVG